MVKIACKIAPPPTSGLKMFCQAVNETKITVTVITIRRPSGSGLHAPATYSNGRFGIGTCLLAKTDSRTKYASSESDPDSCNESSSLVSFSS